MEYAILTAMREHEHEGKDDFWKERIPLLTAQFPTYYSEPQKVWGRFHTSEEQYSASLDEEIIPIKEKKGQRTYVMMQPFVLEPKLTLTVGIYNQPKKYHDQESPIGEVIGSSHEGFKEVQVGNAQAWYYSADKMIVLWECFFEDRFRKDALTTDKNMQNLWKGFEHWLINKFPKATTLATPFNDPIAESIEEYQSFLKSLDYSLLAQGAFGKKI